MITSLLVLGLICLGLSVVLPLFGIAFTVILHIMIPILMVIFTIMFIGALIGFFVGGGGKKK